MGRISLDGYRRQWPRVGGVLAMAVGGATALTAGKAGKTQVLALANYGALLVHQYEEYVDPGWFPGQFNRGLFRSDTPRRYPLNTQSALCVNTIFAYPFYIAPIVFPKSKVLGLAPAIFGMMQAVGHGVIFPRIADDNYSPGFLASLFLHVPIGVTFILALKAQGPISKKTWAATIAYTVGFAVVAIPGPNLVFADKHSPHAFTAKQMGRYDVEAD